MSYERRVNAVTGNITVRVTVGYEGKRKIRVTETFPKGTSENQLLIWALTAKENGPPEKRVPTQFDELLTLWLEHKQERLAVNTFKIYTVGCNAYLRGRLGEISQVTTQDVQWVLDAHKHLSPASISRIRDYLRMVFDYAVLQGYLERSPVTKAVSIPKRRRKRSIQVLSVEQFDALSEALQDGSELELALRTLLLSGLRISELMALEPKHITPKTLTVEQSLESRYGARVTTPPKSEHAYRTLSVPEGLAQEIRAKQSQPFVFPLGYTCLRDGIKRVCKAQGLPGMTLHGLRHSHCTYLLARGVNVLAVSKRLGHHSPAFTLERYGHLVPSMSDKVLEVLS